MSDTSVGIRASEDPSEKRHPEYEKTDTGQGKPRIFKCDGALISHPTRSAKACLKMAPCPGTLDSWEMHGCLLQTQKCVVADFS